MRKFFAFTLLLNSCLLATAQQDLCSDLNKIYATADSLDAITQQHKGDTAFFKTIVFKTFEAMQLGGVKARLVKTSNTVIFNFDETTDTQIQAKLEMCIERLVKQHNLYSKLQKADEKGFRMTLVFKNKKDERALFFVGRGSYFNEKTKQLESNKLFLVYRFTYYP